MGQLTTHVLDTSSGCPAAGLALRLYRVDAHGLSPIKALTLNADGRADAPLLQGAEMQRGRYRLVFELAAYFRAQGHELPEPAFLDEVLVDFGIADPESDYHVPLLASPWSYATYRGS